MVSFICDACQETVKKPKVENHYKFKCRDCWILSCVDCGVRFEGDQYKEHTTCISEAEKYQGALYQGPKAGKTTGKEDPQERWTDAVTRVAEKAAAGSLPALSKEAAETLQKMTAFDNVPRKQKKFANYIRNSFHVTPAVVDSIWNALQDQWGAEKVELDKIKAEAALAKKQQREEAKKEKEPTSNKKRSRAQSDDSSSSSDSDSDSDAPAKSKKTPADAKADAKAEEASDQSPKKQKKDKTKKASSKTSKSADEDGKAQESGQQSDDNDDDDDDDAKKTDTAKKVSWKKELRVALTVAKKNKMRFNDLVALLRKGKVELPQNVKVKKYLNKRSDRFKLYPKKDAVKLLLKK